MEIMTFSALWTSLLLTRQLIQPYWLTHSLNMQILHLDQALLWSFREIGHVPDFPLKPLRGTKPARQPAVWSLWQRSVQERVNNNKGEVGESLPESHVVCAGKGRGMEGREESGACCRRNSILSRPVWSQRRNIRRWLQLDAGGVRWVGRREQGGDSHCRTHSAF